MEAAKAAIKDFTSKAGHHDTTVHEHHKPAVTHEHVTPTTHHEERTAVDREVHQEHHHTTVQPIQHREVLPEKHEHNLGAVETRERHHGDHRGVQERIGAEASQFADAREMGKEERTHEIKPVVGGEHVHHHIHETIQPVIQKETVQPTVIHSTIPVHEVHHNEPIHHTATAAPAVSMADFKKQGGSLTGQADRTHRFEGEPQTETAEQHERHATAGQHHHGLGTATTGGGVARATASEAAGTHHHASRSDAVDRERQHDRNVGGTGATNATGVGMASTTNQRHEMDQNKTDPRIDPRVDSSRSGTATDPRTSTTPNTATNISALDRDNHPSKLQKQAPQQYADTHSGSRLDTAGDRNLDNTHTVQANEDSVTSPTKKASLIDRLNPLKDSDGDGKKGVMK